MSPSLVSALCIAGFFATDFFLRQGSAANSFRAGSHDRGTTGMMYTAFALVVLALIVPLPGPRFSPAVRTAGAIIAVAALVFRVWAMRCLGPFYTRTLQVADGQRVVERGPYRWVRHPGYLSSLLIWPGAAVASGSVAGFAAAVLLLGFGYGRRIRVEERMLHERLGEDYAGYCRRTKRLMPFLF
jgi:protein-S-isoprenylcysteine O-methyltransferase Ste14